MYHRKKYLKVPALYAKIHLLQVSSSFFHFDGDCENGDIGSKTGLCGVEPASQPSRGFSLKYLAPQPVSGQRVIHIGYIISPQPQ